MKKATKKATSKKVTPKTKQEEFEDFLKKTSGLDEIKKIESNGFTHYFL